jgi:hypothetical protein
MSGIEVYSTDLDRVRSMLTSATFESTRLWLNERNMAADEVELLRRFVRGETPSTEYEELQMALASLFVLVGRNLPNAAVTPYRFSDVAATDEYLHRLKIPVRFADLVCSTNPVGAPLPSDGVLVGYWSREHVETAWSSVDWDALSPIEDPIVEITVYAIRDWLEIAHLRQESLVGYYFP